MKFFIISILIAALAFFFLIKPYWEERTELTNELLELNDVLSKKIALQEKMSELIFKYNEAKQYEQSINLAIPNSIEEETLIAQIDAVAANSAVALKSLGVTKGSNKTDGNSGIQEVALDISIEGNLLSIEKFLELAGNSMRILEISSIGLSSGEAGGIMRASIIGRSFFK